MTFFELRVNPVKTIHLHDGAAADKSSAVGFGGGIHIREMWGSFEVLNLRI